MRPGFCDGLHHEAHRDSPLLLLPLGLQAEEVTTINIRKGDTTSVALATLGGGDGPAATKVLQNDLQLSGWFSVTSPDRASYTISGSAAGGTLQGKVADQRGSVVLQKSYTGDTRSATHQFADDIVETLTGHKGIANTKIAFVSNRSGKKEIYTADYDGANVRQLTHDNNISVAPGHLRRRSQARLRRLCQRLRGHLSRRPRQRRSQPHREIPRHELRRLLLARRRKNRLHAEQGRKPRTLRSQRRRRRSTPSDENPGRRILPTWSPNGSEIVYSSDERGGPQLYRIGSGGGSGELISTGYGYCTEPSWSPDGKKLAFTGPPGRFPDRCEGPAGRRDEHRGSDRPGSRVGRGLAAPDLFERVQHRAPRHPEWPPDTGHFRSGRSQRALTGRIEFDLLIGNPYWICA